MTTTLHGFDAATAARLNALRERVRRIYPTPACRYEDYRTACWLGFWKYLDATSRLAEFYTLMMGRSEWTGELVDVTFTAKVSMGIHYITATLQDCMTVAGLTREQALRNLDDAVRNYLASLETKPNGPHGRHQIAVMRRYLMQRKQGGEEACPCDIEPCQCEQDTDIAYG